MLRRLLLLRGVLIKGGSCSGEDIMGNNGFKASHTVLKTLLQKPPCDDWVGRLLNDLKQRISGMRTARTYSTPSRLTEK